MAKLRLDALAELDPLAVPLPHGTEVTTRVDRVLGDRRVMQGAMGRVVATPAENLFDVNIMGVGVVRYARDELTPRKVGQARYARRRADAWEALTPCKVLETTVGSRAWGLSDAGSDTDLRGVFALPFSWTLGLAQPPLDLVSADGSASYWECGKAVRQALRADPNTLEALFVKSARPLDPIGEWLLAERDCFVSSEVYGSFGRYALSQLRKLSHSLRLAEHRADVLAWLREDPAPSLDEVARRLWSADKRVHASEADGVLLAKQYIKQLYRSMFDQGLLEANDFVSLVKLARNDERRFDLPRELRPKNAYNLLRLMMVAVRWLETGAPEFEVTGDFRARLLAIKKGDVPLADVLAEADGLTPRLDAARRDTKLPKQGDIVRADALLRRIGEELARRHVERAPGPWGAGAPEPPAVEWDDGG